MPDAKTAAIEPLDLLAMMRHRRSSRTGFLEDKEVSPDQITLLLEAARAAPSGGNAQPWEFIVIRDKDMRMRIADLYKHQLRDKLELDLPPLTGSSCWVRDFASGSYEGEQNGCRGSVFRSNRSSII